MPSLTSFVNLSRCRGLEQLGTPCTQHGYTHAGLIPINPRLRLHRLLPNEPGGQLDGGLGVDEQKATSRFALPPLNPNCDP